MKKDENNKDEYTPKQSLYIDMFLYAVVLGLGLYFMKDIINYVTL